MKFKATPARVNFYEQCNSHADSLQSPSSADCFISKAPAMQKSENLSKKNKVKDMLSL